MSTVTLPVPSQYVLPDGRIVSTDTLPSIKPTLSVLGKGASRKAYGLTRDLVLKVDTGSTWAGNCRSEIAAWEKLSSTEIAQYLAPVLAGDPDAGWLIMVRATHHNATGESAHNAIPSRDLSDYDIRDLHAGNVGWITSETGEEMPVVIDYAFNGESRGEGCSGTDGDDDTCGCGDCGDDRGTRTRRHDADTTCGYGTCEVCHGEQTIRHNAGTTCCQTDCEMCYPYGRYCAGRDDCDIHPDAEVEMPNGDRIGLCENCRPNTAFYAYVHGPHYNRYQPVLAGWFYAKNHLPAPDVFGTTYGATIAVFAKGLSFDA